MVKLTIKLPSFSAPTRPVGGDSPGFKPAMPGTKEAEEYAASAEARAQAAPFSSSFSLKRKAADDVDAPACKRINSVTEGVGGTSDAPPVSRLPSVKFTFKRPDAKPPMQDEKKPIGKVKIPMLSTSIPFVSHEFENVLI